MVNPLTIPMNSFIVLAHMYFLLLVLFSETEISFLDYVVSPLYVVLRGSSSSSLKYQYCCLKKSFESIIPSTAL